MGDLAIEVRNTETFDPSTAYELATIIVRADSQDVNLTIYDRYLVDLVTSATKEKIRHELDLDNEIYSIVFVINDIEDGSIKFQLEVYLKFIYEISAMERIGYIAGALFTVNSWAGTAIQSYQCVTQDNITCSLTYDAKLIQAYQVTEIGDSIDSIAIKWVVGDLDINQVKVAIYKKNKSSFDRNMKLKFFGLELMIPHQNEIAKINKTEALLFVHGIT